MKKALVTGGKGFIGGYLVKQLLSRGIEVIVIDKAIQRPTYFDINKAQFIEGDTLSRGLLRECLDEVDSCFHLAAVMSFSVCSRDWIFGHANNVLTFNNLLEELRHLNHSVKLVYASSCAVYAGTNELPSSEFHKPTPFSTYGADKITNELYAQALSHQFGIHSIGLRLFNVYGPGQIDTNSYAGVITYFKNAIQTGKPIRIFGDGYQTRDFVYIDDVVEAFIRAAYKNNVKSEIYNVCTGRSTSILDLAETMMNLSGKEVAIIHENARIGDPYHSLGDPSLAKKELGFSANTLIDAGLANFYPSIHKKLTLEIMEN